MASKATMEDAYLFWLTVRLKRNNKQLVADQFGVSRQTVDNWFNKPIKGSNGQTYSNWDERYLADTEEARAAFQKDIENRMKNGMLLIEVIRDDMLMNLAVKVKESGYSLSKEDVDMLSKLSEIDSRSDGVKPPENSNTQSATKLPRGKFRLSSPK